MANKTNKTKTPSKNIAITANTNPEEKVALLEFSKNAVGIYGSYVIENRALADIRDGLKPVHRRILWTMHKLGLNSKGPTKKSARVVGECLALYHPHGDCLAGDTLVYTLDGSLTKISEFAGSDNPWVLAYDETTDQIVPARAYAFRVGQETKTTYRLTFDDQSSLELTGNHPVFTEELGWLNASLLQPGLTIKSCLLSYINSMVWLTSGRYNGFLHQIMGDYLYGAENSSCYLHLNQDTLDNRPENIRIAGYLPQDGTGVSLDQVKIQNIEIVNYDQDVQMYDFTVDTYHNMFVATRFSDQTVSLALVHNSACYEALTNMAGVRPKNNKKDWLRKNVNIPMIEGRGNFGDHVDGPAAQRYCVVAGTKVMTANGLVNIEDIPTWRDEKHADLALSTDKHTEKLDLVVMSDTSASKATKWINSGQHEVITVNTSTGYRLTCTPNHPLLVLDNALNFVWKEAGTLASGDRVCVQRENSVFPTSQSKLPDCMFNFPTNMSEELAYILGAVVAEGFLSSAGLNVIVTRKSYFSKFVDCWDKVLPEIHYESRYRKLAASQEIDSKKWCFEFKADGVKVVKFFESLGLKPGNSYNQVVPEVIFRSSKSEVAAFLQAMYEGQGSFCFADNAESIKYNTKSYELAFGVRQLLLNYFGIVSGEFKADAFLLNGRVNLERFSQIDFTSKKKKKRFNWIVDKASTSDTEEASLSRLDLTPSLHEKLLEVRKRSYFYAEVTEIIKHKEKRWVYDLTVENTHAFVANGFVVHNTECKLSDYADYFLLDPDYLAVTPMLPNYSDDFFEPVILPAKLPNLLLNGSEGIAVGVSSYVPSFSFEAVKSCAILALTGKLTAKSCVKALSGNFSFPYGGFAVDESELAALVETGQGSFILSPEYDDSGEDFLITSVCPRYKFSKNKPALLAIPNTAYAKDHTGDDGIRFVCRSSKKLTGSMRTAWMNQLKQAIQVRVSYRMAATIRHPDGRVEFTQTSVLDVLQRWAEWRIELETAVITHKVKGLKREISKLTALIKAISNLEIVFEALKKKGTVEYENKAVEASLYHLIDNLGISLKQAELIMETKVRRLQALEKEALVKKKKELVAQVNDLNADLQDVASRIVKSL